MTGTRIISDCDTGPSNFPSPLLCVEYRLKSHNPFSTLSTSNNLNISRNSVQISYIFGLKICCRNGSIVSKMTLPRKCPLDLPLAEALYLASLVWELIET